eukprot:8361432-Pyramimonas_sp.AAC.1
MFFIHTSTESQLSVKLCLTHSLFGVCNADDAIGITSRFKEKKRRVAQQTLQPRQPQPSRQLMLQPQSLKALPQAAPPPRDSELSNDLALHHDRGTSVAGSLIGPPPMHLRLPAQPRQAPMMAGSIMTGSCRGQTNPGLMGPSPKDWLQSRLAAARAMVAAPGRPWAAPTTRPSTTNTRPRMEKSKDGMHIYPGIIKSPFTTKRGNGLAWTNATTSSSVTLGCLARCQCFPRRLRRRRDRRRRARAR